MGYTNSIFEGPEGTFLEEDGRGLVVLRRSTALCWSRQGWMLGPNGDIVMNPWYSGTCTVLKKPGYPQPWNLYSGLWTPEEIYTWCLEHVSSVSNLYQSPRWDTQMASKYSLITANTCNDKGHMTLVPNRHKSVSCFKSGSGLRVIPAADITGRLPWGVNLRANNKFGRDDRQPGRRFWVVPGRPNGSIPVDRTGCVTLGTLGWWPIRIQWPCIVPERLSLFFSLLGPLFARSLSFSLPFHLFFSFFISNCQHFSLSLSLFFHFPFSKVPFYSVSLLSLFFVFWPLLGCPHSFYTIS